jgi:hypothetical protein
MVKWKSGGVVKWTSSGVVVCNEMKKVGAVIDDLNRNHPNTQSSPQLPSRGDMIS